jgi:hypothetical protein
MAKRGRSQAHLAWWTGMAAVAATAAYAGTWRMWALAVLAWSMYELCFCPTTCGVAIRDGTACRNPARGRLFACTGVTTHQHLKTDALWHLPGQQNPLTRLRKPAGAGAPAAHRKAPLTPSPAEHGYVERNQRVMAYLAVASVVVTTIEAAVGLAVR